MKRNIVGPSGVVIQARSKLNGKLDTAANQAIEDSFADWAENYADFAGMLSWVDIQKLWINCAATDGEFIFAAHSAGPYGFQLETIDAELLDVTRNQTEINGNVTRLGVEYSGRRPVRYWFRSTDPYGNYSSGMQYSVAANRINVCYLHDWSDQSRGIPWGYSALTRFKHLDALDDAGLTAARAGASKMGFFKMEDDEDIDETEGGKPIMEFDPGTFEKIGPDDEFIPFDPTYPHEQYEPFTKKHIRDAGAGFDISYASLSGDMSDVNYSSIRWGGQDERETFISLQNWFVRCAVKPIFEQFIRNAVLREKIKIGGVVPLRRPVTEYYAAHYQGRRWASVDQAKESKANRDDIELRIKSPQQIIRDRGDDPESVIDEIRQWQELTKDLKDLGGKDAEGKTTS